MPSSEIDLLLIGHITADLVPDGRELGGTPSYAAYVATAFGLRIGAVTSAAVNEPLLDNLRQYAEVVSLPADETTTYVNIYDGLDRKQLVKGVAAPITLDSVPEEWRSVPLVLISPMAGEVAAEVATGFPDSAVLITPQGWMRRWGDDEQVRFKHWFNEEILRTVDFVVISDEDIAEVPEMEQKYAEHTACLIVTRSDSGGTYYKKGQKHTYDAVEVDVVDLTGAGDVFAASFFSAWHKLDHDIDAAIRVAAYIAAQSISRAALDSAPTPEEVAAAFQLVRND